MARKHDGLGDLEAALVDLDGTLVDTLGDFVLALQGMLQELPLPYSQYHVEAHTVAKMVGKGSEHLVNSLLAHIQQAQAAINNEATPVTTELQVRAQRAYQHHYAAINGSRAQVYPGAREGLEQMAARGWKMACVTNKPTALAEQLLKSKGLDQFFAFTLGGDALPRKKPDPLPLLVACERLGSAPARTLMVGDSSNDAQAARAAGCPVLLVRYGYNHGQPIGSVDADAFTDTLQDWAPPARR